jgi:hypothetical protein
VERVTTIGFDYVAMCGFGPKLALQLPLVRPGPAHFLLAIAFWSFSQLKIDFASISDSLRCVENLK